MALRENNGILCIVASLHDFYDGAQRNEIFCLYFTTNENTADRQISLFGEGLARTTPNTTWIIVYITRSITDGYKLLFSTTCANSPCGILWKVHFQSRCEHITICIFGECLYTRRWCPNVTQKRKRLYIWLSLLWTQNLSDIQIRFTEQRNKHATST